MRDELYVARLERHLRASVSDNPKLLASPDLTGLARICALSLARSRSLSAQILAMASGGDTYGRSDRPVPASLARTDSGVARAVVAHRPAVVSVPTQAEHVARQAYSDAARNVRAAELLNALDSLSERERERAIKWALNRAQRIEARKRGEDPSAIEPVDLAQIKDLRVALESASRHLHAQDGRDATAARWLRDYKASDHVARYADLPDQKGALVRASGRTHVRGSRRMGQPIAGPPRPNACTLADAHARALQRAIVGARDRARAVVTARNARARKAAISHMRAHLRAWEDYPEVLSAARAAGWRK